MLDVVPPLFWLSAGILSLFVSFYVTRDSRLSRRSDEYRAGLRQSYEQRFPPIAMVGICAYCLYASVRHLVGGSPTWPLWLLAACAQLAAVACWRGAARRLRASPHPLTPSSRRRYIRAGGLALVATVCLYAAPPVARSADASGSTLGLVASVALVSIALLGFIAAGWAAVWVSKEERAQDRRRGR